MKITGIRATTVTVPLETPLRHANGYHWGRFVRTIVEVETDEGLIGLGEMGGGGESAESLLRAMKSYLVGHDPTRLEQMWFLIANPTASLYNNSAQILAAPEFACLDILGQKWGVSVLTSDFKKFAAETDGENFFSFFFREASLLCACVPQRCPSERKERRRIIISLRRFSQGIMHLGI
jgi:hypothetical protein